MMPQEIPLRLSLLGRHLSPVAQLIVVAAFILISGAGFLAWLAIGGRAGDRSEQASPAAVGGGAWDLQADQRAMGRVQDPASSTRQFSPRASDRRQYRDRRRSDHAGFLALFRSSHQADRQAR